MPNIEEQKKRIDLAQVEVTDDYYSMPEDLGTQVKEIPQGFKLCGHCKHVLKLVAFNKDSSRKDCCSGSCKQCQKEAAKKSYKKTKKKRLERQKYADNKDVRRECARRYYAEHTEECKEQHKKYLQSKQGKEIMQKAHKKRREAMKQNAGIPYTREMIIDRDSKFIGLDYPVCSICGQPITDTSGQGAHIDHIIGVAVGGIDCFTNVRLVHKTCNLTRPKDLRDMENNDEIDEYLDRTDAYLEAQKTKK